MDTRTGEIYELEEVKKKPPQEQKYFKEIPQEYLPQLERMNRKERRAWYSKNKKLFKSI